LVRQSLDRIADKTGRPREDALAAMIKDNPLGRLILPEEVAAAVLALCAPDASAITGEALAVAGGEI
jgi:NAD(P)-dependent dehydrogenase (short-subunit alcohol dehydrogenase family)